MEVEPLSNRRNPKFLAVAAGIAFLKKIHTWAGTDYTITAATNGYTIKFAKAYADTAATHQRVRDGVLARAGTDNQNLHISSYHCPRRGVATK